MKMLPIWGGLLLLGLTTGAVAEAVYRSVDAEGRVTYSDMPPADGDASETVNLLKPLSEARRREAETRQKQLMELVSEREQEKALQQSEREDALGEAERAVEEARKRVDDAKVIRAADWWGVIGSGQLKPEYQERVSRAEKELKAAERNLRMVRSGQK